jgi:outer membrane lipoprotein-sorting protein
MMNICLKNIRLLGLSAFVSLVPNLVEAAPLSLDPAKQEPATQEKAAPARTKAQAGANQAGTCEFTQLSTKDVVSKANTYLNGIKSMQADFSQIGMDGRRFKGTLYVVRPGRLLFDYDPPSPQEVVSDGTTVVVRNKKLKTQSVYSIGQTPLKFLLKDKLDLNVDSKVIRGNRDCEQMSLTIEDKSTVAGTSTIRLQFAAEPVILKQWVITDPNGNETVVQISNIDTSKRPHADLFKIDTTRELDVKGGN